MASLFEKIALGLGESLKGAQSGMALIEEIKKRKRDEEELQMRKGYYEAQKAIQEAKLEEDKRASKELESLNKKKLALEEKAFNEENLTKKRNYENQIDSLNHNIDVLQSRMAEAGVTEKMLRFQNMQEGAGAADKEELRNMNMTIADFEYRKSVGKLSPEDLIKLESLYRQRAVLTGKPYIEPSPDVAPQVKGESFWNKLFGSGAKSYGMENRGIPMPSQSIGLPSPYQAPQTPIPSLLQGGGVGQINPMNTPENILRNQYQNRPNVPFDMDRNKLREMLSMGEITMDEFIRLSGGQP